MVSTSFRAPARLLAQEHERFGRIAHDHAHNRVINGVKQQRLNIYSGIGERLTRARARRDDLQKHRELGSRFKENPETPCRFKVTPRNGF